MALKHEKIDGETLVSYDGPYESWWLSTPYACGWIATNNRRVVTGAPIFRRIIGWDLPKFPTNFHYEKLCDETEATVQLLGRAKKAESLAILGAATSVVALAQQYEDEAKDAGGGGD
jgi:hypothetical protein